MPLVSPEQEWNFLVNEQKYLSDEVRFADQKAGLTLTFAIATLGFLSSHGAYKLLFHDMAKWTWVERLSACAIGLLILSCMLAILALVPRLWNHEHKGLVFWGKVAAYSSAKDYVATVHTSSLADLNIALGEQCFALATVCSRKYLFIKWALIVASTGSLAGLLALGS